MTTGALSRFVMAALGSAIVLHVIVSLAAASALDRLYPHRIFNVRAWADAADERRVVVGSFLVERSRSATRPLVAFVGSSVAYGYPWHERFIASQVFAEAHPDYRVINPSVLGVDVSGINELVLCAAEQNGVRFDVVVIEIPVVNTTSYLVATARAGTPPQQVRPCEAGLTAPSYRRLALTRARGIGWLHFMWNSDSNQTEDGVSFDAVPRGYFADTAAFAAVKVHYSSQIAALLRNAQQVAARVYAFPSPIYLGGLAEVSVDRAAVRHQLDATVDACASVPGVECIETSTLWHERSNYYNFTHLSQAGHRRLATMIGGAIGRAPDRHSSSN